MKAEVRSFYAFLLVIACTSDEIPTQSCLVDHISLTSNGGSPTTVKFYYGAGGRLDSTVASYNGLTGTTYYAYDTEGQRIRETTSTKSITFLYNASHQRIRDSSYYPTAIPPSWTVIDYTYNSSGQLTESVTSSSGGGPTHTVFTYPNTTTRNYSSYTFTSPITANITSVEYDTHAIPNGFRSMMSGSPFQTDNFMKKSTIDFGSTVEATDFSYAFNTAGYPTSIQTSSPSSTTRQDLTYTCH